MTVSDQRPTQAALERSLWEDFGFRTWKPGQEALVDRVLRGEDALGIMPTAAGKSLCYQLPALHLRGVTVVVSPLIALMRDQVRSLRERGIPAVTLNSDLSAGEERAARAAIATGRVRIVYATPERLGDRGLVDELARLGVALFAIDEAHCISRWGHDFRPAYLELRAALEQLGEPTVLALTATATPRVIADIRRQLGRPQMGVVQGALYRANLHYRVVPTVTPAEKWSRLERIVRDGRGSGILYCATVKTAVQVHEQLAARGLASTLYHGRLGRAARTRAQDEFITGTAGVMVATNAFGLGIDRPDIRFIVHVQMPGSLDAYYQESGRAGRDGKAADCILLYDRKDKRVQQFFLARHCPDPGELLLAWQALLRVGPHSEGGTLDLLHAHAPQVSRAMLRAALQLLREDGHVRIDRLHRYRFAGDPGAPNFEALAASRNRRFREDKAVLERMVGYAQTALCRWHVLLTYFGSEEPVEECGTCDNCLAVHHPAAGSGRRPPPVGRRLRPRPGMQAGDIVSVASYGRGQVLRVSGDKVTVRCADHAERTFLRSYVRRIRRVATARP